MPSMKFSSVASLVLLAMVCSRITVFAFDDALAPLPAMATGSAVSYSASGAAMAFSLM